jgi:hypothetical protein
MKNFTTRFMDKSLRIELSRAALRALERMKTPLLVEMELYFGCLIRKQVRFHGQGTGKRFHPVNGELSLAFRPVVTQGCSLDGDTPPPVAGLDIQREQAFIPRWLRVHYRNGEWQGSFGY